MEPSCRSNRELVCRGLRWEEGLKSREEKVERESAGDGVSSPKGCW